MRQRCYSLLIISTPTMSSLSPSASSPSSLSHAQIASLTTRLTTAKTLAFSRLSSDERQLILRYSALSDIPLPSRTPSIIRYCTARTQLLSHIRLYDLPVTSLLSSNNSTSSSSSSPPCTTLSSSTSLNLVIPPPPPFPISPATLPSPFTPVPSTTIDGFDLHDPRTQRRIRRSNLHVSSYSAPSPSPPCSDPPLSPPPLLSSSAITFPPLLPSPLHSSIHTFPPSSSLAITPSPPLTTLPAVLPRVLSIHLPSADSALSSSASHTMAHSTTPSSPPSFSFTPPIPPAATDIAPSSTPLLPLPLSTATPPTSNTLTIPPYTTPSYPSPSYPPPHSSSAFPLHNSHQSLLPTPTTDILQPDPTHITTDEIQRETHTSGILRTEFLNFPRIPDNQLTERLVTSLLERLAKQLSVDSSHSQNCREAQCIRTLRSSFHWRRLAL